MFDTIYIRLENVAVFNSIILTDSKDVIDRKTGEISISGKWKNLWIHYYAATKRLIIKGSISEYQFENNIITPNLSDIKNAFDRLSLELGVDIYDGIIFRLDISDTIEVDLTVKSYNSLFAEKARHIRSVSGTSVYFSNTNRITVIYDKTKEMRAKQKEIPEKFRKGNWMRIEVRYMSTFLRSLMNKQCHSHLTVKNLIIPEIYAMLVLQWQKEYFEIKKKGLPAFNAKKLNKPSDINKYLAIMGIERLGGIDKVMEIIDYSINMNPGPYREFSYRIRKLIRDLMKNESYVMERKEIKELDQKVKDRVEVQLRSN